MDLLLGGRGLQLSNATIGAEYSGRSTQKFQPATKLSWNHVVHNPPFGISLGESLIMCSESYSCVRLSDPLMSGTDLGG